MQEVARLTADSTGDIATAIRIPLAATGFTLLGAQAGVILADAIRLGPTGAHMAQAAGWADFLRFGRNAYENRILFHGFAAFAALTVLLMTAVPAVAQGDPPHVVESSAGALSVVDGNRRFSLVPDEISDSDLAAGPLGSRLSCANGARPAGTDFDGTDLDGSSPTTGATTFYLDVGMSLTDDQEGGSR